jgi:hypothetical protein
MEITEAREDEDVSRCSLSWERASHYWRGVNPHEVYSNATKAHLLLLKPPPRSRSPITHGRPYGGLQTLTNFPRGKSQAESLQAT